MVGDQRVTAMERRVEAGDLDKFRLALHEPADRGEIVRLVKWRQRTELFETRQHLFVDDDGAVILRATMNDAVSDGCELGFLCFAQPIAAGLHSRGNVRNFLRRIGLIDQRGPIARLGP